MKLEFSGMRKGANRASTKEKIKPSGTVSVERERSDSQVEETEIFRKVEGQIRGKKKC